MSGTDNGRKSSKGLSGVRPRDDVFLTDVDISTDIYEKRVAIQQFFRENQALFEALIRQEGGVASGGGASNLEALAYNARDLAKAIVAAATGAATPESKYVKVVRPIAAHLVAEAWIFGEEVQLKSVARQIADAISRVDEFTDGRSEAFPQVSDDTDVMIAAAYVSASIHKSVMTYSFRRDPMEVSGRMCAAVLEAAQSATTQLLPTEAVPSDRRALYQSMSTHYADLMVAIYDRVARQTVSAVYRAPEREKAAYLEAEQPIERILHEFRDSAVHVAGMALAVDESRRRLTAARSRSTPLPDK